MRPTLYLLFLIIVVLTTGCAGSGAPRDTADRSYNASFDQTMSVADSLYNRMQFRDAYELYLHVLESKEAEANSEKRLHVLYSLCNASELSGHKVEEHKWLRQLVDLATQTGNDYYLSLGLLAMGQNLFYEGDREKGLMYVINAIDLMVKLDRNDTDHLAHTHLIMLARLYGEIKDYDNALKTNERNLRLTMQGTRWGGTPNQQLIDRRMALGRYRQAAELYEQVLVIQDTLKSRKARYSLSPSEYRQ